MKTNMRGIANTVIPFALALVLGILGALPAAASEATGTLSVGVGQSSGGTSGGGSIGGTVVGGANPSSSGGSGAGTSVASRSGGSRRFSTVAATPGIQSDGSLASVSDFTGIGGGYDPDLDSRLASLDGDGNIDSGISASDAIAYNSAEQAIASLGQSDDAAAAAGSGNAMSVVMAVLLGLAVAGLGGYAVSAYLAYRREDSGI
ncbi:MAG TPA: hypothetical protein VHD69_00960 [Candidatus Paceibacterota bacterium]|jgi:hypothetical protein|nr:hypothetical protein [Candidatus Paceibacterota bacterium]